MVLSTRALISLALAIAPAGVLAAVPAYGQCGGVNYTGETTCVSGYYCLYQNDYYSQCVPGTASTTATTAKPTTSSTTTKATSTSTKATSTSTTKATTTSPVPTSAFVKTSGTKFVLNGQKFTVVGSNAYWMAQLGSTADITSAFNDLKNSGVTVLRTWGFNEVLSASGTYYQIWNGATPTVNTGADGLAKFDTVVAAAGAAGIKLIVALTNNWGDYGGMDVYTKQIAGSANHDVFYTNTAVKTAFKNYINAFVSRYKTNTNIMAWELANEPRCGGSTGTTSGTCTTATITAWIKEISAYIKSIDSNHLVAVGDEGFYNQPSNPSYPYQGHEGIDFDVNLAISTIDFGTAHAYPIPWGQTSDPSAWGVQWIKDHATSQTTANKPVILEEFGVTTNQAATYTAWYNAIVSSGLAGDLIWQAGSHLPSGSDTWNDGYAVFPGTDLYTLQTQHCAALKARA